MKKLLLLVGITAGLIVAIAVFLLLTNLGSIVKTAIEKVGTDATQAPVTIASVDISLDSGEGSISGLVIGNPVGFEAPSAFELDDISLKIDLASLSSDTIVIDEIVIAAPKVTYEVELPARSNIATIRANVDAYAERMAGGGGGEAAEQPPVEQDADGTKLVIENLYIREGEVEVAATLLKGSSVRARLPEIHLRNIGKGEGGASPAEVAAKILDAMTGSVLDVASGLQPGGTADEVKKTVEDVVEGVGDALKGLLQD